MKFAIVEPGPAGIIVVCVENNNGGTDIRTANGDAFTKGKTDLLFATLLALDKPESWRLQP